MQEIFEGMYTFAGRPREAADTGKEGMRAPALAEDRLLMVSGKESKRLSSTMGVVGCWSYSYLGANLAF